MVRAFTGTSVKKASQDKCRTRSYGVGLMGFRADQLCLVWFLALGRFRGRKCWLGV